MPPPAGLDEDASAPDTNDAVERTRVQRLMARLSFDRRPSFNSETTPLLVATPIIDKAPIPSIKPPPPEAYATPLPALSMVVLSITLLGEFLSANVSMPFILFMVKGFGELKDDAEIAFWTGILVSAFFLTQFLTAILWATAADKFGRRAVLVVSLLGSATSCVAFGMCTTLDHAILVRLLQGVFAGAVGVARGAVSSVTDATNEARAYAILGFCWGLGGVAGAIVGGSFESPAVKWPEVFGQTLFHTYPYLLPCAVAASVTLAGATMGCFLGPDGGPRESSDPFYDPIVEDVPVPTPALDEGRADTLQKRMFLAKHLSTPTPSTPPPMPSPILQSSPSPSPGGLRLDRTLTFQSTVSSRTNGSGFYGSTSRFHDRLASNATLRRASINSSVRRRPRRESAGGSVSGSAPGHRESFAGRLLMANENTVNHISDLWVAAAMNVDAASLADEEEAVSDGELDPLDLFDDDDDTTMGFVPGLLGRRPSRSRAYSSIRRASRGYPRRPSFQNSLRPGMGSQTDLAGTGTPTSQRFSAAALPAILSNPGVRIPSRTEVDVDEEEGAGNVSNNANFDALVPIAESRPLSLHEDALDVEEEDYGAEMEKQEPKAQLPIAIIVQYGLLALHTTTHDQVFLSYLVSDYEGGGLALNAVHFAQLTAMMCLAQIVYQFYLYPNLGSPRGPLSHLTMFRLGSALFIPSYLVVVFFRPFAEHEENGFVLMAWLTVSAAVRYCGGTFGYTAVSILLNCMTPPESIGLANGVAQSIVSLARCVGPVLGGFLWSVSVEDHPSGYPLGFIACAAVCFLAVLHSFTIR